MSSSRANAVSEINLEEFERRLRAVSTPQTQVEDPLAELTRLVDTIAADRPHDDKVIDFASTRLPKAERFEPVALTARATSPQPVARARVEAPPRAPETPAPVAPVIELRGSVEEPEIEHDAVKREEEPDFAVEEPERRAPARVDTAGRPQSWYLKVGGLTALALIMAAGATAWKVGMPGTPKKPPLILAAETPVKVAPPKESTVQSANDSGALPSKDPVTPAPVKLVTNEEQPIDLTARAASNIPKEAPSPVAPSSGSPIAPTADTPIVPPVDSQVTAAPPASAAPKRVKTVSVRPDGTLIASADVEPTAAAAPAPSPAPKKVDTAAVAPQAATPNVDLPAKPLTPKSSARVAVPKIDTTVPADATGPAPLQIGPTARADKPAKLPTKLRPPAAAAVDAAPASADAAPAPAPSGGDWAVQLAAPRSEADAQSAISRLQGKYGDELGGTALGVRKADVNGSTIYRVRASGMSKSEAAAMCAKLKAAGGDCFVAKN